MEKWKKNPIISFFLNNSIEVSNLNIHFYLTLGVIKKLLNSIRSAQRWRFHTKCSSYVCRKTLSDVTDEILTLWTSKVLKLYIYMFRRFNGEMENI